MKWLLLTARASAWNRRGTLSLVALSIALATALLLTVEGLRHGVREGFSQAVSGTDLVVGARTGPVQLMLYAVFRVGGVTNNVSMDSVRAVAAHRAVDWVVPLSLGDSHRGYPVMGTTAEYFTRFRWGDRQPLALREGRAFSGTADTIFEAVLGADVARALGYRIGDRITLTHGTGAAAQGPMAIEHADRAFAVTGILQPTGTPVDRTVHVSLQAITALHLDWVAGVPLPGVRSPMPQLQAAALEPRQVTAALVGLNSRAAVFAVQRFVADHPAEPLMAVLPGVALDELWTVVGFGERALLAVSGLVALVSLAGLVAVVLAGLNERRRELAVLRAVGAGPGHVVGLLALEGAMVTLAGALAGVAVSVAAAWAAGPLLQQRLGIALEPALPTGAQWALLGAVLAAGMLTSLLPAWRAYRLSLADGLSPRL